MRTNSEEVARAAERNWGGRPRAFDKPPLEVRVIVGPDGAHPQPPVYRGQEHLMSVVSDRENFAVVDYTRNFAFCRLNEAAAADTAFVAYYFLDAIANFSFAQLYLTPVHGACVARDGRAVLLCGASGAGKTSVSYFCAKRGWTYVSDNESWLLRSGGLLLIGNPQKIRFRDSAVALFPELTGMAAESHPNGKMSIEVSPQAMGIGSTAYQSDVDRVVFLSQNPDSSSTLRALHSEDVVDYFMAELPVYEDWVREEQQTSLWRIAELRPVELRYANLESAYRHLESLIR